MEKISVGQIREIADMGEEAKRRIAEALQISIISTEVYLASEVDALLADVRALVDAAKRVQVDYDTLCVYVNDPLVRWRTYQATVNVVQQAIAAVERHLETCK